MERLPGLLLTVAGLTLLACSTNHDLPEDDTLEVFIRTSSRCAYIERAYSGRKDLLRQEMASVGIPDDWDDIVDSLLSVHGADPDFWYQVYSEISDRSRSPLPPEEAADITHSEDEH
jgi:hypothetical protein